MEALVVDDSTLDGTDDLVRKMWRIYGNTFLHVRPAKLGLGIAITDGFRIYLSLP